MVLTYGGDVVWMAVLVAGTPVVIVGEGWERLASGWLIPGIGSGVFQLPVLVLPSGMWFWASEGGGQAWAG